jgi:hypothetical protein
MGFGSRTVTGMDGACCAGDVVIDGLVSLFGRGYEAGWKWALRLAVDGSRCLRPIPSAERSFVNE